MSLNSVMMKMRQVIGLWFRPSNLSKSRQVREETAKDRVIQDEAGSLNFRFGFLFCRKDVAPESEGVISGWLRYEFDEFVLWLHPQSRIREYRSGNKIALVIGDCYSLCNEDVDTILEEVLKYGLSSRIDGLGGRYAVIVIEGGQFEVAHDAFGSRSIFYLEKSHVIASHAALIAYCYRIGRCDLMAEFMALPEFTNRSVRYLPGDKTVYHGIFALVPNNSYDGNRTQRYWPRHQKAAFTKEQFLSAAQDYLDRFREYVSERFRPLFGITGGVDSRAIFCAFPDGFDGVTWTTRYLKEIERPVVEEIVAALSINHKYLDHRSVESGAVAEAARMSGGRFRPPSRLTEVMAFAYPKNESFIFVRGYGGEILRGFKSYFKMKDLSVDSMVRAYGSSQRKTKDGERYLGICSEVFKEYHRRGNYNGIEKFGYQSMDVFYWEHRMGMWGASMLNEMDPAMPSLVGLNSRRLFEIAFGIEDERRLTKQLLQDVVASKNVRLANIPYF